MFFLTEYSQHKVVSSETALIVEGGAMRSVFSAGLLDGFLDSKFNPFDFYIGVSGGAYNLATYMAGTPGKSLAVFLEFALHKNFISYFRFIRGGHLLDLDWLFNESLADNYLDVNAVFKPGKPLYVCTTKVSSGKPVYINTRPETLKNVIKASTALPLLYRGFPEINGIPMTDGGVADGIPVAKAIELGAKQIFVVRSRHKNYMKKDTLGHRFIRWKLKKYNALTATLRKRVTMYEDVIELIRTPPEDVKIIEFCPPENFIIGRFSRSRDELKKGYEIGFESAVDAIHEWDMHCRISQNK